MGRGNFLGDKRGMPSAMCTLQTNRLSFYKENHVTISGLLMLGAAEVFDSKTQELLGYVFTVAHGQGQLQRWLLFRNPNNQFEIRPPSESMAQWSLEDWQKHVIATWRPNGFYVWAQADVYKYGGNYDGVTWTRLPSADDLPKPSFPDRPGSNFQLDFLDGKLIDVRQEDGRGHAYVVRGLENESSIEYWALSPRYKAAASTRTEIAVGNEAAASLEGFVKHCQGSWSPGSTFVITGCLNHHGAAVPFAP